MKSARCDTKIAREARRGRVGRRKMREKVVEQNPEKDTRKGGRGRNEESLHPVMMALPMKVPVVAMM